MSSKLISTDSHVIEPPDLWTRRIEGAYRGRAPQVVKQDGREWWIADEARIGAVSGPLRHGARGDASGAATAFCDVRPAAYTPDEYVQENLDDGVVGSLVCPTYGLLMYSVKDHALLSAICRAYNDWIAEFCQTDPVHLRGVALLNNYVPDDAVAELERAVKLGLTTAMLSVWPGLEFSYRRPEHEALWTAAERLGVPLLLHSHSNHDGPYGVPLAKFTASFAVNADFWVRMSLSEMILSGVFHRHPKLKVVSAENEGGWAPYFLGQLDSIYWEKIRPKRRPTSIPRPPSAYFHENVFVSIIHDRAAVDGRAVIGVNNMLWGSDYPHDQSTYPRSREAAATLLAGVPDYEASCILFHNAADLFGFDVVRIEEREVAAVTA